ncbi:chorismate mutase [Halobaculum sp. MBLA0147]|uniref:chorismate mutase n=1 Tax=Halobaculum sp. MBLA0147 TaxID=3079934 RepID=UPI003524AB7C
MTDQTDDTDETTADWGSEPGAGTDDPDPEEMTLAELREEIRSIDRELVELIARRTYVADTIADVKAAKDLPTTDESQEQAVMDRAGENAEQFEVDSNLVKAIFRLLIELNKVEQRERR